MKQIKCIGILTSGGDASGMNAAIRAVTRSAIFHGYSVKGIYRGYEGLIRNEIKDFTTQDVSSIIQRGGTILKTARSKDFMTPEGRKVAYDNMVAAGIDALVIIGGNGSLTGALTFAQEFNVPCIGLPGTIDNDLYGTDSTIGYDTALNTIVECVDKIRDTATSHDRIFFVEVMGRDAGFLAQNSAIASGAERPNRRRPVRAIHRAWLPQVEEQQYRDCVRVAEGRRGDALRRACEEGIPPIRRACHHLRAFATGRFSERVRPYLGKPLGSGRHRGVARGPAERDDWHPQR